MDKILFLDFDGVISIPQGDKYGLCAKKLGLMGEIIDETDCRLVISSSWRLHDVESTIKYLSEPDKNNLFFNGLTFPFCDRIIGVTERLYTRDETGIFQHQCRGEEIKKWMEDNNFTGNYVIVDDENDMLPEQMDYFVQTDGEKGLMPFDVDLIIAMLNEE
jgi:hypothetical protein